MYQTLRALDLARLGQHVRAVTEARGLETLPQSGDTFSNIARIYVVAAAHLDRDATLNPDDRSRLREAHEAHAVKLLSKAEATGYYRDPARQAELERDPDFRVLLKRTDFADLRKQIRNSQ